MFSTVPGTLQGLSQFMMMMRMMMIIVNWGFNFRRSCLPGPVYRWDVSGLNTHFDPSMLHTPTIVSPRGWFPGLTAFEPLSSSVSYSFSVTEFKLARFFYLIKQWRWLGLRLMLTPKPLQGQWHSVSAQSSSFNPSFKDLWSKRSIDLLGVPSRTKCFISLCTT